MVSINPFLSCFALFLKENSKESLSQFNRLGKVPRMQPQKEDNAQFCLPFCRTAQPYGHKVIKAMFCHVF